VLAGATWLGGNSEVANIPESMTVPNAYLPVHGFFIIFQSAMAFSLNPLSVRIIFAALSVSFSISALR